MKRILIGSCLAGLACFTAGTTVSAQQMGPPKVVQIIREEVKAGKGSAHTRFESNYVAAFRKANWPTHYLSMNSTTGPSEAWFLVGFGSFEAWEQDTQNTAKNAALTAELDKLAEQDTAYIGGARTAVAIFRPDLSYRPNIKLGEYRYFEVDTVRVRLGHGEDFAKATKAQIDAHEKLNIDEHWAAFEVVEGMASGTILFFTPMKSLKQEDMDHGKQVMEAMGEENAKRFQQVGREGIISDESNIFAFSPGMSYLSDETTSADPTFWKPKASAMGAKPAAAPKKAPGKQPTN